MGPGFWIAILVGVLMMVGIGAYLYLFLGKAKEKESEEPPAAKPAPAKAGPPKAVALLPTVAWNFFWAIVIIFLVGTMLTMGGCVLGLGHGLATSAATAQQEEVARLSQEELALPELDEEDVAERISRRAKNTGWRPLPVVLHRYPPHQSRKTVFEAEFDPRKGKTVMTDLDLSQLEIADVAVQRLTPIPGDVGDIYFRLSPGSTRWRLNSPGGGPHLFSLGDEAGGLFLEPGENAGRTKDPARVKVTIKPRSDLRAIWVRFEREIPPLPPSDDLVDWGRLPGKNYLGFQPLHKVTLLVQAFEPGGAGKPLSADFLRQLPAAEKPEVIVTIPGKSGSLDSSGTFRLEYDPSLLSDEEVGVVIRPRTGKLTCTWRVSVRCDWYTN